MPAPRFDINFAQQQIVSPLADLNRAIDEMNRDRKIANIRLIGTCVGFAIGAATAVGIMIKK
jgi:hypothetical protein